MGRLERKFADGFACLLACFSFTFRFFYFVFVRLIVLHFFYQAGGVNRGTGIFLRRSALSGVVYTQNPQPATPIFPPFNRLC